MYKQNNLRILKIFAKKKKLVADFPDITRRIGVGWFTSPQEMCEL